MTATDPAKATPAAEFDSPFRVSSRADYSIRALTEMAASGGGPVTAQRISHAQAIPLAYLLHILTDLRRAGLVRSHRGTIAGYELARPATRITLAEVIAVIERDLSRPTLEEISYPGAAEPLKDVWLAVRSSIATVLGSVTLADVAGEPCPRRCKSSPRGHTRRPHPEPPTEGGMAYLGGRPEPSGGPREQDFPRWRPDRRGQARGNCPTAGRV